MTIEIENAINVIWDYMQLRQPIVKADALILLGSRDDRVANYAAGLLQCDITPICVVTGGVAHHHDLLATKWDEASEADHFIAILRANSIDESRIYKEAKATITGENVLLSHKLLVEHEIYPKSILIVTKPYMERRALATFQAQWPDADCAMRVSSMGGTIAEYCADGSQPFELVVNIMVGDFQRIMEYPRRGFLVAQQIPQKVHEAYDILVKTGYTQQQLKDRQ
jgi:uncharacterized SAM-binding protein YcdF (DUF218 family)